MKPRYTGVTWYARAQKYRVRLKVRGKYYYLGLFVDPAEGHAAYEAAKALLYVPPEPKEKVVKNMTRQRVAARWGLDFWQLIADFAYQGLSRFDTARAIGYRPDSFCTLLSAHPEHDPFDPSHKPSAYVCDTGEPFVEAVKRMADSGMSLSETARAIGYSSTRGLRHAMGVRGVVAEFKPGFRPPKAKPKREPQITRGWPTWKQIYASRP